MVFYIFYPKKVSIFVVLAGILTITIILFIPLQILFGFFYNHFNHLQSYDKIKTLCKTAIDTYISLINHIVLTISAVVIYQLQNPLLVYEFMAIIVFLIGIALTISAIFIKFYLTIIKKLKQFN